MNFENIKIPKYVKQFIEDYIEVIDSGKIDELFQLALIEAELSESDFNTLCNILNDIDLPAFEERDKLFTDLFDQYMEMNETDYFMNDADRLVEIMDTMSTAECLGLDFNKIVFLLSQWSAEHPHKITIEGSNLNDLKIRFLVGNGNIAP